MWYIYLLVNKRRDFQYIGMSTDLKKRLESHNKGKTRSTKPHRPFNKIFSIKAVSSRIEARKLEKYYKSGIGREVLKQTGYSLDG